MDPPYAAGIEPALFKALSQQSYVTEHTLLILEAAKDKKLDFAKEAGFSLVKEKLYKTNKHVFFRKQSSSES